MLEDWSDESLHSLINRAVVEPGAYVCVLTRRRQKQCFHCIHVYGTTYLSTVADRVPSLMETKFQDNTKLKQLRSTTTRLRFKLRIKQASVQLSACGMFWTNWPTS